MLTWHLHTEAFGLGWKDMNTADNPTFSSSIHAKCQSGVFVVALYLKAARLAQLIVPPEC